MTFLILVVLLALFIIADLAIRTLIKNAREKKIKREREAVLQESLSFDFSNEAKSLKRVEVQNAKAKILCVDDEEIILDSFRKILVIDGYSIDTVEKGQEALGLIQKNHYDFVFTDLKMPEMSGEEVCKAVKNVRPDIDVIIITGYASVSSAVECMKYGAMDYLEKPFTEDELLKNTKEFLIKRKHKIDLALKPSVHITHLKENEQEEVCDFAIPGGVFISKGHVWTSVEQPGNVKVGIDDFAKKIIGRIDGIEYPNLGMEVYAGQSLFSIKQGNRKYNFYSPVSGKVIKTNKSLIENLELLDLTTYSKHWICELDSEKLDSELKELKIGRAAVSFFQHEIDGITHKAITELNIKVTEKERIYKDILQNLPEAQAESLASFYFGK